MRKIPCLFERDFSTGGRRVLNVYHPDAMWVAAGEGVATRKFDGTACLVRGGRLFKRYDAKNGKQPPPGFEPSQPAPDAVTGHWPGWLPVGDGPEDKWHREAWAPPANDPGRYPIADWTYELCGPRVQSNPERLP